MGMVSCRDDVQRFQLMQERIGEIFKLASNSNPPSGIDMTIDDKLTVYVKAEVEDWFANITDREPELEEIERIPPNPFNDNLHLTVHSAPRTIMVIWEHHSPTPDL